MRRGLVIFLVIAAGTAALGGAGRLHRAGSRRDGPAVRAGQLERPLAAGVHGQHARPGGEPAAQRHLDRRCQGRRRPGPPDRRPRQRHQPGLEPGRAEPSTSCRRAAARPRSGGCPATRPARRRRSRSIRSTSAPSGSRPTARQLAVALEVYVDCADLSCTADRVAAAEKRKATGRLYDSLLSATGTPGRTAGARTCSSLPVDMAERRPPRRRDEGHGRRQPVEAVRRRRGVHLHARQPRRWSSPRATPAAKRRGRRTSISGCRRSTAAPSRATSPRRTRAPTSAPCSRPTARRWRTARWRAPATKPTSCASWYRRGRRGRRAL